MTEESESYVGVYWRQEERSRPLSCSGTACSCVYSVDGQESLTKDHFRLQCLITTEMIPRTSENNPACSSALCVCSALKKKKCNRRCSHTYHKSTDASLRRFPFEAAVDVAACVDQEHDAASDSVEVAQKHLKESNTQKKERLKTNEVFVLKMSHKKEKSRLLFRQFIISSWTLHKTFKQAGR